MNIRNISLIIYRTAGEIRKHVLKPKPFVLLRVQGNIDTVKLVVTLKSKKVFNFVVITCSVPVHLPLICVQWTGTLQLWHLCYI